MAAPAPLDETVYRKDDMLFWWDHLDKGAIGPFPPFVHMEERFIHRYFFESPFFDHTSKNGIIFNQANVNLEGWNLTYNRKELEAALRRRPGLEYVIVGEPQVLPAHNNTPAGQSNVWVIRGQERLGDQSGATREDPYPKTETRSTYYIVNENIYHGASVADVVGNRLLGATTSLEKMFEKIAGMPTFAPMTGHTWLPPRTSEKSAASAVGAGSANASPARSREGSVVPGMDSQSLRSGSAAPESQAAGAQTSEDILKSRLLGDSLNKAFQYGDEFMDENPILGEPGNFRFTSSTAAVKKRKADEEAAVLAAQKAKELRENSSRAASPKPVKAPTPPPVFTEARAVAKSDKDKREERKKRRKSRPNAGGTPKSATSTVAPGVSVG